MSDDEEQFNPKAHKKLLQGISSLGKAQHIRKTTRNEPIRQQDEFQLVKPVDESVARYPVGLYDIVRVLQTTNRHIEAGKQLKVVQSSKKVLDKPLEKPQADRIKRGLGYDKTKKNLNRWDAVVTHNRNAETQVFPLRSETIYVDTSMYRKPLERSLKSDLARELEAEQARLKAVKRELTGETENEEELAKKEEELLKKKLTRDEQIARRKELAYLKLRESQKSLKARKQNKIKSKKYHKLLKKQKMQEQIKQFEILQKTNPEAALEKLNELEKSRVLERANLRHKNTGTWAKNLQIRAKYDKEVRKDLAEQLQISRQLTKKQNDSDEENENEIVQKSAQLEMEKDVTDSDPFNPWTRVGKVQRDNQTTNEEGENWRKYWLDRNQNEKLLEDYKKLLAQEKSDQTDDEEKETKEETVKSEKSSAEVESKIIKEKSSKKKNLKQKGNTSAQTKKKENKTNNKSEDVKTEFNTSKTGEWLVEDITTSGTSNLPNGKSENNIDDIFDKQEDKIRERMSKKLKKLNKKAKLLQKAKLKNKKSKTKKKKDELKNLKELSFQKGATRPVIDEELITENTAPSKEDGKNLEKILENDNQNINSKAETVKPTAKPVVKEIQPSTTIDPNKLADVKIKQKVNNFIGLNETIGAVDDDIEMSGDEEHDKAYHDQQLTISQAFEDDDIIADFTRDKAKDSEIKNAEIDLFMPGWGSWAGAGISAERQVANKSKRLVLKLAKKEKRRDDNKGGLYINESASKKLRTHLVSEVPFPFTSVADYEGSIRATIGRNCVPETAFRMLTRPAVITHKGQVIEPMDQSELTKPQRKLRNVVDKRIARMNENTTPKAIKSK
ncbi:U3 small nucleolar RNA-associated protein 14 homolog A [Ceratitis capitata]|uniref:U3 small nucleolar RNA-associated protein 14 homolog A n=1 Tax=Ceratitis capitata TaxID=7213 RepID=UPI000329ACCF|nr:U3 small nucleolar RNA-associated protein 14 homolog A [Ceratitis capitata]